MLYFSTYIKIIKYKYLKQFLNLFWKFMLHLLIFIFVKPYKYTNLLDVHIFDKTKQASELINCRWSITYKFI